MAYCTAAGVSESYGAARGGWLRGRIDLGGVAEPFVKDPAPRAPRRIQAAAHQIIYRLPA